MKDILYGQAKFLAGLLSLALLFTLVAVFNVKADDIVSYYSQAATTNTITIDATSTRRKVVGLLVSCVSCSGTPRVTLYDGSNTPIDWTSATTGSYYVANLFTWDNQPDFTGAFKIAVTGSGVTGTVLYRTPGVRGNPLQSR